MDGAVGAADVGVRLSEFTLTKITSESDEESFPDSFGLLWLLFIGGTDIDPPGIRFDLGWPACVVSEVKADPPVFSDHRSE
jgi:hypothetical protein